MGKDCCKRKSTKTPSPAKKSRSAVLSMAAINDEYVNNEDFVNKFRKELKTGNKPFPHWQLHNFVDNSSGIIEDVEQELQDFPKWRRKENDLYSLYQTEDFKALEISEHPNLFSFRQFVYTAVREWLQEVSGVELISQVDMNGSLYSKTDGLLPHSDQINTRRFAFVYYITPFIWDKKNGGELSLYSADGDDQPKSVFKQLPPTRNSLVLFEVSHRSWHRVEEVLTDSDPRLSINGWFHSERRLEPKMPKALVLPRSLPLNKKGNLNSFVSPVYIDSEKQQEIRTVFGDKSEICLKEFLQEKQATNILASLRKMKFENCGPANKRSIAQLNTSNVKGELGAFLQLLQSSRSMELMSKLTGCELKGCEISFAVNKIAHGSYTVVGDEDADHLEKEGFSLEAHVFLGDGEWVTEAGGDIVYVARDDDEELMCVLPCPNSLSLVFRDPEVFSFLKYVNCRAQTEMYWITVTYHNVKVEDSEDEDS